MANEKSAKGLRKKFKCSFCDKEFNQNGHRKEHERHHTGEKPFQCEVGTKSFYLKSDLKIHAKFHSGTFQCQRTSYLCKLYFWLHSRGNIDT